MWAAGSGYRFSVAGRNRAGWLGVSVLLSASSPCPATCARLLIAGRNWCHRVVVQGRHERRAAVVGGRVAGAFGEPRRQHQHSRSDGAAGGAVVLGQGARHLAGSVSVASCQTHQSDPGRLTAA